MPSAKMCHPKSLCDGSSFGRLFFAYGVHVWNYKGYSIVQLTKTNNGIIAFMQVGLTLGLSSTYEHRHQITFI